MATWWALIYPPPPSPWSLWVLSLGLSIGAPGLVQIAVTLQYVVMTCPDCNDLAIHGNDHADHRAPPDPGSVVSKFTLPLISIEVSLFTICCTNSCPWWFPCIYDVWIGEHCGFLLFLSQCVTGIYSQSYCAIIPECNFLHILVLLVSVPKWLCMIVH